MAGAMHQVRAWQAAALLPSGLVLVAGGCTGQCTITATAELYHPHTGSWANTGSMHDPREQFTMTLLPDGRVLAAGGCRTPICSALLAGAELYHPRTGTWTQTGAMHERRAFATATLLLDGRVLVAGGITGGCPNFVCQGITGSAEIYNPRTDVWTLTGTMHQARARQTATLLPSGQVLVVGGASNGNAYASDNAVAGAELYNPRTGVWTVTGSLHDARAGHAATLLGNGLVLVVGSDGSAVLPAELYHPRTGAWTLTGSPHHDYYFETGETATRLLDGQVLVAGNGNGVPLVGAELYNPHTGGWTSTASLHAGRGFQPSTLLATGQVLVEGGVGMGNTEIGSAEVYQP